MATLQSIQFRSGETGQHFGRKLFAISVAFHQSAFLDNRSQQFRCYDVNLFALLKGRVFKVWMDRNSKVCR